MGAEVKGIKQLRSDLRKFDPELKKEMDKQLKAAMLPIRDAARGFVPDMPPGLSNWTKAPKKESSRYGSFPLFDGSVIRKGIVYRSGANKANANGFQALFYIANLTAAGAIYETAGRKNPSGQPWKKPGPARGNDHGYSYSDNPDAGRHFIQYMPPLYGKGKERGRLIYKAWEKDQGKATLGVIKAIDAAVNSFNRNQVRLAA